MEYNRRSSMAVFLIFSICVMSIFQPMVDAQLTFSQNWGKRASSQANLPLNRGGGHKSPSTVSNCGEAYTESLLRLHELMMETYANYQQCQRNVGEEFAAPPAYARL